MSVFNISEIGGRIVVFREFLKKNQKSFSSDLGFKDSSNLSKYERGADLVTDTYVLAMMETYDLNPAWLYFGEGPMQMKDKNRTDMLMINPDSIKDLDSIAGVALKKILDLSAIVEGLQGSLQALQGAKHKPSRKGAHKSEGN